MPRLEPLPSCDLVIAGVDIRLPGHDGTWWSPAARPLLQLRRTGEALDVRPAIDAALDGSHLPSATPAACFVSGECAGIPEHDRTPDALTGFVRAARAIREGRAKAAVVLDTRPPTSVGETATLALVLCRADAAPAGLAVVKAALHRAPAPGDPGSRFSLLMEACASAGDSPRTLTLLDVIADTEDGARRMLDAVARPMSRNAGDPPHCALGSADPDGDAFLALCLQALAIEWRVLPPAPARARSGLVSPFCADDRPRAWIETSPRRSALWAATHRGSAAVVLEQPESTAPPPRPLAPWRWELIAVSASTREALALALGDLRERAASGDSLQALAQPAARDGGFRAAIVAADERDFVQKLERLLPIAAGSSHPVYQTPDGIFFDRAGRLGGWTAVLFPGQGSQYVGMFGDLALEVAGLQEWFDGLQDSRLEQEAPSPGQLVAPPAYGLSDADSAKLRQSIEGLGRGAVLTMASSLALWECLEAAGVRAGAMTGYSNGENAALAAADTPESGDVFAFMRIIRMHDDEDEHCVRGVSLAVNRAPRDVVDAVLAAGEGRLFLALDNCPDQIVLFGDPDAIQRASDSLTAAGGMCLPLAFAHGHHTPRFAPRAAHLRPVYDDIDIRRARVPVYSCATAAPFPAAPGEARDVAVGQWARPVRFGETIERLYADGARCFLEVGPGSTLTGFVRSTLRGRPHAAIVTNVPGRDSLQQLLHALARLFVIGHDIDTAALQRASAARVSRPYDAVPMRERSAEAPARGAAASGGGSSDAARRILDEHFRLMDDFLAAQERANAALLASLQRRAIETPAAHAAPACPLLGTVTRLSPSALRAACTLSVADHPFLWHHAIGAPIDRRGTPGYGLPVVPFALSVELVAEAAAALLGISGHALTLTRLRALRWMAADEGVLNLQIEAERIDEETGPVVRVQLLDGTDGRVMFEGFAAAGADPIDAPARDVPRGAARDARAFSAQLFHGPMFRPVSAIEAASESQFALSLVQPARSSDLGLGRGPLQTPVVWLDGVGQAVCAWLVENGLRRFGVFPFEWGRYRQTSLPPHNAAGTLSGNGQHFGSYPAADVVLSGPDGRAFAAVDGARAKIVTFPEPLYSYIFAHDERSRLTEPAGAHAGRHLPALPPDLLADGEGLWLRVLAAITLDASERRAWSALPADERQAWLTARIAVKEVAQDALAAAGERVLPCQLAAGGGPALFTVTNGASGRSGDPMHVRVTTSRAVPGHEPVDDAMGVHET